MRFLLIVAAAVAVLVSECLSKVAPTTLQDLTARADLIVIGRVTRLLKVKGVQVAEVRVASRAADLGLRHHQLLEGTNGFLPLALSSRKTFSGQVLDERSVSGFTRIRSSGKETEETRGMKNVLRHS